MLFALSVMVMICPSYRIHYVPLLFWAVVVLICIANMFRAVQSCLISRPRDFIVHCAVGISLTVLAVLSGMFFLPGLMGASVKKAEQNLMML